MWDEFHISEAALYWYPNWGLVCVCVCVWKLAPWSKWVYLLQPLWLDQPIWRWQWRLVCLLTENLLVWSHGILVWMARPVTRRSGTLMEPSLCAATTWWFLPSRRTIRSSHASQLTTMRGSARVWPLTFSVREMFFAFFCHEKWKYIHI